VQRARPQRTVDGRAAHTRGQQLRPGHDPVLIARDRANCLGLGSV
jgi:hypothetical protein